jgi:ATP-dependent RNA helicase HelY
LTPGEFTQLTGRAGRRGIDLHGHAVVLWSPFVPFDQVAALASSKEFQLNSAFRPTYNMAANLVRSYTSEEAHHLLNLSFAQYQADRDVVKIEARIERRQRHLRELSQEATSAFGDIDEYRRLLKQRDSVAASRTATIGRDDPVTLALMKLQPGDVIYAEKGRYAGRVAVLSSAHRKNGIRLTGMTTRRDLVQLAADDFDEPPRSIGRVELPEVFAPNTNDYQRQVAQRLEQAEVEPFQRVRRRGVEIEQAIDGHPVEADPDLEHRLKAAAQAERVTREIDEMRQRMRGRSQTISRDFDRVLRILDNWGYVDGWTLTEAGDMLARTFHECDLLIVECLRHGLLDDLEPAVLAGMVSVFVYEHRSSEAPPAPWFPSPVARRRWQRIAAVSDELRRIEAQAGLAEHRAPDPTFIAIAYAWAAGEGFAEVVEAEELSGGDFVRTTKQLIDVLRQLAIVAPQRATRRAAETAASQLFRGVVASSSAVELDPGPDPGFGSGSDIETESEANDDDDSGR